jgi:hypothetical protein
MATRPMRAIAFHESTAMEQLEAYFASSDGQSTASTRAAKCDKCDLIFAVIVTDGNDPRNSQYLDQLQTIIAKDCITGMHKERYVVSSESADHIEA